MGPKAPKEKVIPKEVALAHAAHLARKSQHDWCWEVNYAINSRHPRFFVYNTKTGEFYKYKTAHGIGGSNRTPKDGKCREFSNVAGSFMSSLGVVRSGNKIRSDATGISVRLQGLSITNSRMGPRGCHLHGGSYVVESDNSVCGYSQGCVVTDDKYISRKDGGELIEWLKDGSIGVIHHNGNFFEGKV